MSELKNTTNTTFRLEIPVATTSSEVAECRAAANGYEIPGFLLRAGFLSTEIGMSTLDLVHRVIAFDAAWRNEVALSSEAREYFGLDKLTKYVENTFCIGVSRTLDFGVCESTPGGGVGSHTDEGFVGMAAHFDCSEGIPSRPVELMITDGIIKPQGRDLSSIRDSKTDGLIYANELEPGGLLVIRQGGRGEHGGRVAAHNFGGHGKWVRIAQS